MPTAEERAAAIKASQEHWRKNLAAETPWQVDLGIVCCALCRLYHPSVVGRLRRICIGCPVKERSGHSLCRQTPYSRALRALQAWNGDPTNPDLKAKWRAAALAECEFLESLK